ncbi:cupin conserved barrel [Colletotrichum truncatum]|uniref:Cupin conserved barrel n=1 Tax=Colletotrichum truncatum TaxID=5467 RepID=A0ACC3YRA5_COLTU|nr:cupin conserved barrel [Colletotrichum truncatum]KAF6799101.1 cupin conserved barrel [Colletotrichum truncatum]
MDSAATTVSSPARTAVSEHRDGGDTIHCENLKWHPLASKVWIKLVKLSPETGTYTVIIRAEKGGVLPRHRHIESAEIYVLRGDGNHPQTGHFAQGDFVSERKGAIHDPLVFEEEVEMLMMSNGPSAFIDDEGRDLFLMDVPMLQRLAETEA